jgi:hypothetical protein
MAKMKKVTISAFIPQLPAGHAYQAAHGSGGSLGVAIKRAVDDLLKLPCIKSRRLSSMRITVAVIE